jgi:hypothetical protein
METATKNAGTSREEGAFRLPRSSYNELVKIIMAYGKANKPASLEEISHLCGVGRIPISANNSFLSSIGVIEGGKAKLATSKGLKLARALEHEQPEQIKHSWQEVVFQNPFLQKMLTAIRIRRGFDVSGFESHIAYSSGEPKSAGVMTGARTVIDILRAADAIREQDGKLQQASAESPTKTKSDVDEDTEKIEPFVYSLRKGEPAASGMSVHFEISLQITPSDLEGLGEKLRNFLQELNREDSGASGAIGHSSATAGQAQPNQQKNS